MEFVCSLYVCVGTLAYSHNPTYLYMYFVGLG